MTPSIDQRLHLFANLLPNWTLIPILTLLPNFEGFHRTLQRVRLANRGRLLLRTPGPVPFGTCICSNVETILSWTCHVYGPFEFRTSLGTSILLWTDFWFKILLKFKASMPLFANFIFRNGRFFVSVLSHTLTALNSLFEEMSKIILWTRCSGDAASAKCKVKVDSYKSCSMFKGREYSLVRIW